MRLDPHALHTASDVERAALALLGDPLRHRPALSHVAAIWSPDGERQAVMRIDERTPRSDADRFLLNLARARADAIVTTGATLRAEPSLRFVLEGPEAPAMMRWRIDVHGLLPPSALVLTTGADLDPEHPALHGPANVVLLVPQERADAVRKSLRSFKWVNVQGDPRPSLARGIAWLRSERGVRCISVEAGPSVARALYEDASSGIDEVLLGRYTRTELPEDLVAGDLPTRDALAERFRCAYATRPDADGWNLERWVAR